LLTVPDLVSLLRSSLPCAEKVHPWTSKFHL
jgi:hypothetical protein